MSPGLGSGLCAFVRLSRAWEQGLRLGPQRTELTVGVTWVGGRDPLGSHRSVQAETPSFPRHVGRLRGCCGGADSSRWLGCWGLEKGPLSCQSLLPLQSRWLSSMLMFTVALGSGPVPSARTRYPVCHRATEVL